MRSCSYYALQHLRQAASTKQSLQFSTSLSQTPQHVPVQNLRAKRRELSNLLQSPISGSPILLVKKLHATIVVLGLHCDVFLANILLDCYAKSGSLRNARKVFDKMSERNLISWSSVVSMYAKLNYSAESFTMFLQFHRSSDECPNEYILASVVRACTQLGDLLRGSQVHSSAVKTGLDHDVYVGTALLGFYAKNGDIDKARLVFDGLSVKTAVTWTSILTGYVKIGRSETSLELFRQMKDTHVVPDRYVLSSVLSACSALGAIEGGKQIHAYVLKWGEEMDVSVVNVLVDSYTKCGRVHTARRLFDRMEHKDVISWTTMIAGYMQNSYHKEAMKMFSEMSRSDSMPDGYGCTSILTSCGSLEALEQGRQVHGYTIKANLELDAFVKNGLIDFYAKCGSLAEARLVFDTMADHNVVSYNAMIEGYTMQEMLSEALVIFHKMRLGNVSPSQLTFVSVLGSSAALCEFELSRQIHCLMIKYGVSQDMFSGSSLIDVYSKSSCIKDAKLVFQEMGDRDIVVWNAMLFGYTQQLEDEEALKLYLSLLESKEKPNEFTFAAVITAASNLASLKCGQQLHGQLMKMGSSNDPFVTNALVDMYAKCGSIEEACKTFDCSVWRDVACWNSMITTYAQHGEPLLAIQMFEEMISVGIKPNYVTYVGVLSACSHAGLVEDGLHYFNSMSLSGIDPGTEHYACVVSLLGRGGRVSEAKEFINKMPVEPAPVIWRSLLSACRIAGNVELGRYAAEKAISLDPTDSGSYTLLSNIYASKGMWVNVKKVRAQMDLTGAVKEPGQSWVELGNEVSVFVARDSSHNRVDTIYSVLNDLVLQMKDIGYVPDISNLVATD